MFSQDLNWDWWFSNWSKELFLDSKWSANKQSPERMRNKFQFLFRETFRHRSSSNLFKPVASYVWSELPKIWKFTAKLFMPTELYKPSAIPRRFCLERSWFRRWLNLWRGHTFPPRVAKVGTASAFLHNRFATKYLWIQGHFGNPFYLHFEASYCDYRAQEKCADDSDLMFTLPIWVSLLSRL